MPWGRGGVKGLLERNLAKNIVKATPYLAGKVDKEAFLKQLRQAWYPYVRKNSDIETELERARGRIEMSGPFKIAFEKIGITDDDLREVLKSIQDDKPLQVKIEKKPGRNDPCSCGSGKKYKKCCGK